MKFPQCLGQLAVPRRKGITSRVGIGLIPTPVDLTQILYFEYPRSADFPVEPAFDHNQVCGQGTDSEHSFQFD